MGGGLWLNYISLCMIDLLIAPKAKRSIIAIPWDLAGNIRNFLFIIGSWFCFFFFRDSRVLVCAALCALRTHTTCWERTFGAQNYKAKVPRRACVCVRICAPIRGGCKETERCNEFARIHIVHSFCGGFVSFCTRQKRKRAMRKFVLHLFYYHIRWLCGANKSHCS